MTTTFEIAVRGGTDTITVTGDVKGLFGIHESGLGLYTVTHLPTGWSVQQGLTQLKAQRLRDECIASGEDWQFALPTQMSKSLKAWGRAIKRKYPAYEVIK